MSKVVDYYYYADAKAAGVSYWEWYSRSNLTIGFPWVESFGVPMSEVEPACLEALLSSRWFPRVREHIGIVTAFLTLLYLWIPTALMIKRRKIFPLNTRSIPLILVHSSGIFLLLILGNIRDFVGKQFFPCWLLHFCQNFYVALLILPLSTMVLRLNRRSNLNKLLEKSDCKNFTRDSNALDNSRNLISTTASNNTILESTTMNQGVVPVTTSSAKSKNYRSSSLIPVLHRNLSDLKYQKRQTATLQDMKQIFLMLLPANSHILFTIYMERETLNCTSCNGLKRSMYFLFGYGLVGNIFILYSLRLASGITDSVGLIRSVKRTSLSYAVTASLWLVPGVFAYGDFIPRWINPSYLLIAGAMYGHWQICVYPLLLSYRRFQNYIVSTTREKRQSTAIQSSNARQTAWQKIRSAPLKLTNIRAMSSVAVVPWRYAASSSVKRQGNRCESLTLEQIISHNDCRKLFAKHLGTEFNLENLTFWRAATEWKAKFHSFSTSDLANKEAARIFDTFIADDAPFQVNLENSQVKPLKKIFQCQKGKEHPLIADPEYRVDDEVFDETVTEILGLMRRDCLPRFKATEKYNATVELYNMS